ncbi:MAG: hypothetical protein Q4B26_13830, partial [Eubacteriales bacterium]|nr:hypothetical protein [Eubacteriales bacterium]
KERKKQLDTDIWIIVIVSVAVLVLYSMFNTQINKIISDSSISIVLRVLFIGGVFQFGLAGLGITIVSILRKENFIGYGLSFKNLWLTIGLSVLCCVPDFIYNYISGNIHGWLPFSSVNTTAEVIASAFPSNVLGMLITAICWGFFEGFNYVVIADKLNERYPSKHKYFDWGALVCAVMCILIHGVIGVTPEALIEMFCIMFLIYGMLIVRKITGNAWGCVLIFLLYWNAI